MYIPDNSLLPDFKWYLSEIATLKKFINDRPEFLISTVGFKHRLENVEKELQEVLKNVTYSFVFKQFKVKLKELLNNFLYLFKELIFACIKDVPLHHRSLDRQ